MTLMPYEKVYPVNWRNIVSEMTTKTESQEGQKLMNRWYFEWESYILKMGGTKLLKSTSFKLNEDMIVAKLMKAHCPISKITTLKETFIF